MAKLPLYAVLHDGEYHDDKIVFEPLVDQVEYVEGETLEDVIAKYDNTEKRPLIKGAFVCDTETLRVMCGLEPASKHFGTRAPHQNAHRLRSLASASFIHLGVLPGVKPKPISQEILDRISRKAPSLSQIERLADRIDSEMKEVKKCSH